MRIEDIITKIRAAQFETMETTFKSPPKDHESFIKKLGFYLGLNECLRIIEEARKDKDD